MCSSLLLSHQGNMGSTPPSWLLWGPPYFFSSLPIDQHGARLWLHSHPETGVLLKVQESLGSPVVTGSQPDLWLGSVSSEGTFTPETPESLPPSLYLLPLIMLAGPRALPRTLSSQPQPYLPSFLPWQ